ncbi:hypothetical protein FB446DRAFT_795803 [Lentinula raphanica]|nr:hypothetical protein FB446DRAFT_795803 [Lentinula raphanica]
MAFTQSESTPMTSINCSSESEWIFENGVYDDLPVKDFVHTVLDLSNEEIDAILEYKFKANVIALFEYKQGIETGKYEMELYKPFVTVANDLLASYLAQNCPDQKPSIRLYERHLSRTHTNSRVRRSVAPDVISLWTSSDDPNDMAAIQIPFEFQTQKRRRLAPVDVEDPFINGPISDSRFAAPKNSKPRPSSRRLIKSVQYLVSDSRLRMSDRAKASPALQEMTISSKTSHSSSNVNDKKRKRSIDDVGGRDTLNQNEAQLASYALKCFESTSRLFVAGVYVQHWTMALWYYDRMGAARTVSFQFSFDDVQMLGLVLVALNRSDVTNAGISPFLHTIGPQDPADLLCSTTTRSSHPRVERDQSFDFRVASLTGRETRAQSIEPS